MIEESKTLERRRLAKGLKVWLDILLFLTLLASGLLLVLLPVSSLTGKGDFKLSIPVEIGKGAFQYSRSLEVDRSTREISTRTLESSPPSPEEGGYEANWALLETTAIAPGFTLLRTRGQLRVTPTVMGAGLAFWSLNLFFILALIYGILLLRKILASTVEGFPFHPSNPKRLNQLGWILLGTSFLATVTQFLFGRWALSQLGEAGLPLNPTIEFYEEWLTCGLLVLVLAAIWKEAVRISDEQSLTV